jgi:hypothetical protein
MRRWFPAICLFYASPLHAADTTTIAIDVQATVTARCGVAAIGDRANAPVAIDRAQALTFSFSLDCNTGFRIGVRAAHGALRLTTAPSGARDLDGFGIERDYLVALTLATDDSAALAAGQCSSRDLAEGATGCPFYGRPRDGGGFSPGENRTAINRGGSLTVTWSGDEMQDGRRLAAGNYQDVLTVEVAPRV